MRMDSLRVLVTGGAGFIGSHLVRELVFRGYEVRVLDNLSRGSLQNIRDILSSVELVVRDIRDYEAVEKAVSGMDAVVHLAALTDVEESLREPNLYAEVNVVGTLNLARASRKVDSFIYASSSAVYGDPVKIPIPEDHPLRPKSPYGASKASGELYLMSYSKIYGFRPVILRIFNVYGPRQSTSYSGVIIEFIRRALRGEPLVIYGTGEQTRDFIYVSDVVQAIVCALKSRTSGVFNIGSGEATRILDLANEVLRILGLGNVGLVHEETRPEDIVHSVADITRARRELGFKPSIPLHVGLRTTIERLRAALST